MVRKFSTPAIVGMLLVAALALPSLLASTPAAVNAQETTPLPRTITVVGEGQATGKPDKAELNVGVGTTAASVREAMDQNNQLMQAVMAALTGLGIAADDIQTAGFSVYLDYSGQRSTPDTPSVYNVSNTVLITVRDLDSIGTVLEDVTNAGANYIWGISFGISDTRGLQSAARTAAVADARARAEELAALNGVAVGEVVSISEVIGGNVPSAGYLQAMSASAPISPGPLQYYTQVQMTYTIETAP